MLLRNTMILVLVVWLLVLGWVQSQQDLSTTQDSERRARLKRRMLVRLAQRGIELAERERIAEELLMRLAIATNAVSSSTTESPQSRRKRDHYPNNLHLESSNPLRLETTDNQFETTDPVYELSSPYRPMYSQPQALQEAYLEQDSTPHHLSRQMEEVTEVLREHLLREIQLEERIMERREAANSRREQRSGRNRDRKRRRDEKKKKRKDKKKGKKRDKKIEAILQNENISLHEVDGVSYLDCCPSKVVVVRREIGRSRTNNRALEIDEDHQLFYERICIEQVENKECVFPARTFRRGVTTRCTQQYSYSLAKVRTYLSTTEDWTMDYVEVKSGCSCQVSVNHRKRKRKR